MAASGLDSIAFAAHHRIIPLPRPLTPGKAKGVTESDAQGAVRCAACEMSHKPQAISDPDRMNPAAAEYGGERARLDRIRGASSHHPAAATSDPRKGEGRHCERCAGCP
jgi:hypothetical protein